MIEAFASLFDQAISLASQREEFVERERVIFTQRVGRYLPEEGPNALPYYESYSAAVWDRVLVGLARSGAGWLGGDDASRGLTREHDRGQTGPGGADGTRLALSLLPALSRAQRGLYRLEAGGSLDAYCLLSGAAFRLSAKEDAAGSGSQRATGVMGGLVDGFVAQLAGEVFLLPGALVHPPEASSAITQLLGASQSQGTSRVLLLDGLLALRHRLLEASRMKAKQVYRPETLARVLASPAFLGGVLSGPALGQGDGS